MQRATANPYYSKGRHRVLLNSFFEASITLIWYQVNKKENGRPISLDEQKTQTSSIRYLKTDTKVDQKDYPPRPRWLYHRDAGMIQNKQVNKCNKLHNGLKRQNSHYHLNSLHKKPLIKSSVSSW